MQQDGEKPNRRAPHYELLRQAVLAELDGLIARPTEPGLWLVATPIGNLGDISLRALVVIAAADELYCEDPRHSRVLLARYGLSRPARPYHEHNGARERPRILELLAAGKSVALISDAGTPLISDPGYKLAREAAAAGHLVHALPGPSAVLAALSASGLPTDSFFFAGFLPAKSAARAARLAELAAIGASIVLFEAPGRLAKTLAAAAQILGPRQAAVARELTKRFEEVRRGSLAELTAWAQSGEIKGEIAIVIGGAQPAHLDEMALRDALDEALAHMSLRDATQAVADRLGAPKTLVYDHALRLKRERGDGA